MNHATAVTHRAGVLCQTRSSRSWPLLSASPSQLPTLWLSPLDVLTSFGLWTSTRCTRIVGSVSSSQEQRRYCSQSSIRNGAFPKASRRQTHSNTAVQSGGEKKRLFHTTKYLAKLKAYPAIDEPGLSFRKKPVSATELNGIFGGSRPPNDTLNRFLKVLHARRYDGTLDIALDEELNDLLTQYPEYMDQGLVWLRARFPIDEEKAIEGRFDREEAPREVQHPSEHTERAIGLGLLKTTEEKSVKKENYYGPQSGRYYAEVAEDESDVFGKSEIDRIRKENAERSAIEEEAWNKRVEESMQKYEKFAKPKEDSSKETESTALAERQSQQIELADGRVIRPPNSFERWVIRHQEKAATQKTLEDPEIANMTTFSRIWPSAVFVLLSIGGLYFWALGWEPPRRIDRFFPDVSMAVATCGTIFAINAAVFLLWRFPPALGILNNFFLAVPGYPRALSMLGNIFSHYSGRHLAMNMLGLIVFGPRLHEEIGRANFVMLYLGAGLIGSVVSLSFFTLRGLLHTSSNGASGAIWAIQAAYFWLHKDSDFSFIFIPRDWQDKVRVDGWAIFVGIVIFDFVNAWRNPTIDVVAHICGMIAGVVSAESWRTK